MTNKLLFTFLVFCLGLSLEPNFTNAAENPEQSIRKSLEQDGYVPLNEAVTNFEKLTGNKVKLPQIPFKANMKFGVLNNNLKLKWINTNTNKNQDFVLFVKRKTSEDFYYLNEKDKEIKLPNGNTAYFSEERYFKMVFEDAGLEYCYIFDKDNGLTNKEFIQLATTFK